MIMFKHGAMGPTELYVEAFLTAFSEVLVIDNGTATPKISSISHPEYDENKEAYIRYRDILIGGKKFVEKYLKQFSSREEPVDFANRKAMSYNTSHAESVLDEIKNAIYQRLADVTRKGGPANFQECITGKAGGVDLLGNSMTDFMGEDVIRELLGLGKVGVFVDKHVQPENATKADTLTLRPYVYIYKAEQIKAWRFVDGKLVSLLLMEYQDELDSDYGLVKGKQEVYRLLVVVESKVNVRFFNHKGDEETDKASTIDLPEIPFIIMQLSHSLLKNIDGYQIALLNLASSDLNYALKSNFTFYTEQYDPVAELAYLRQATGEQSLDGTVTLPDGTSSAEKTAKQSEINLGSVTGRRYVKGLERPGFIGPPTEPLRASLDKQAQMRQEIREIANLNVSSLQPQRESADAKKLNERTLEAGLSYIGLELQYGERQTARFWCLYEGVNDDTTINYPLQYTLKTSEERQAEAKSLRESASTISSITCHREVAKQIVRLELGNTISEAKLHEIEKEIDAAVVPIIDPDVIKSDIESRILSAETASKARLYPAGEAEKASKEWAIRTAELLAAQMKATDAARGNDDANKDDAKDEKKVVKVTSGKE